MSDASLATNIAELLTRNAATDGDKVALIDGDRRVTWSELESRVDELAKGLTAAGLVAGFRVGIAMVNSVEYVAAYLAVLRGGMVAVPVNPTSPTSEIARVLADSGARLCFADEATITSVRAAVGGLADALAGACDDGTELAVVPSVVVSGASPLPGETTYDDLASTESTVVAPRDPESLAVLLYTSGTSGRPRAAMLSHRAMLANIGQAASTDPPPMQPDDIVLGVLPLFHVYGLNAVLGQVLLQAATLVLGKRFDPDATLLLVESEQVTCVPVAPPVIVAWCRRDDVAARLASVRTLLSGAAPLSEELVRGFEESTGIRVEQGYGLTETSPIVTSTVGSAVHKPGSAGRAVPGVELRVVDDAGRQVDHDDPGEVQVRGDNVFSGYWPDGDGGPGEDGWLATGDVGFVDREGDLFMVDRLKELVIVSGFNVYPSEIEDVIVEVAGVAECGVIGIPDDRTGEAVVAYVVPQADADAVSLADRVRAHCGQRLARFKMPTSIEIVTELPHSATGKVAKGRLRAGEARKAMGLS